MIEANRYSLSGIVAAILLVAFFSGNNLITRVIAGFNLAELPRELRLGIDSGLVSREECRKSRLNATCNRNNYAAKLTILLEQIGMIELADIKELAKSGIFSVKSPKTRLTRGEAIESMARICLYIADKELISLPVEKATNYRDYAVPQKYSSAVSFMQKRFIIRGYPDGRLGVGRNLTNREAAFFLYRLYETIATDMMTKQPQTGIRFIDISLSHPAMESINLLTQAGAFDKLPLKPAFDGDSQISNSEISEMIEGIFAKSGQNIDQVRLKSILSPNSTMTRRQLALCLEYLLTLSPKNSEEIDNKISYIDVDSASVEFAALKKLDFFNIKLGYQNERFKGNENITWFETISALGKTLKAIGQIQVKKEKSNDRLAQKSDIDELIALIKAKKAKIRQIIDFKKSYER